MCSRHYQQWRKENPSDVRRTASKHDTLPERVAMHSQPAPGGCIVWTGYLNESLPWLGVKGKGVNVRRHVLGAIQPPPGRRYFASTTCGTPRCVNPDHLEWLPVSKPADYVIDDTTAERLVTEYKAGTLNVAKEARDLKVSRPTIYRAMERRGFHGHEEGKQ